MTGIREFFYPHKPQASDGGLAQAVGQVLKKPDTPTITVVQAQLPFELKVPGSKVWADHLRAKIRASKIPDVSLIDAEFFTENYPRLIREQRVEFWAHLLGITMKYECSYNPKSYSVDVGSPTDRDTWSVGLLQMSVCDQWNYGFNFGYKFADLQDPIKNINLAIPILEKLLVRDECIGARIDGRWKGMSAYWGTLRNNDAHKESWNGITNYMLKLNFPLTTTGEDPKQPPAAQRKITIAVVVGHERVAPGAQFCEPYRGTYEYDYNTEIAHLMHDYAESRGVDLEIFLRDGIGISGAYKRVRASKADCCIELHCNAYNGSVKGSEVLCALEDEKFARGILNAICRVFDRSQYGNRGVKVTESGRGAESCVSFPGKMNCLVEPAFCDEPHDAKMLMEKKVEYARALVDACIAFF